MLAYFDCSAGVAGDMLLGALIDAGAPIEKLREGLQSLLQMEGEWELHVDKVWRGTGNIYATKVTVVSKYPSRPATIGPIHPAASLDESFVAGEPYTEGSEHDHPHEHESTNEDLTSPHGHHLPEVGHSIKHDTSHGHHHGPERNLSDIQCILRQSNLSEWVKAQSFQTFALLAEAEARVHGTTVDQIHFHEVGAIDSIIDTVGTILALDLLGIREVYSSHFPFSSGHVHCLHGLMPIPAPATLQLLKGVPVCPAPQGAQGELVTPTGISIVKSLAVAYGQPPPFVPESVGCGAGSKDFKLHPNIVRVVIGRRLDACSTVVRSAIAQPPVARSDMVDGSRDTVGVLQANLDDMNPQVLGYVQERLLSHGALDVWTQHIQMKKNRPGILLSVMCHTNMESLMHDIFFQETTTLGIRRSSFERVIAGRAEIRVDALQRSVRVKTGYWNGDIVNVYPEFEDCKQIATETNLPLLQVIQSVQLAAQEALKPQRELEIDARAEAME